MTISRLLYLAFGILIALFLVAGSVAYLQICKVSTAQTQTAEVARPLQEAVLEMEIKTLNTVRGIVSYVETHDFEDLKRVKDSERDFGTYFGIFQKLATKEQRDLGDQVNSLYGNLEATGDDIMTRADKRGTDRTIIRDYVRAMAELIDEQLQKSAEGTAEAVAVQKLKAALLMKANVQKAHSIYESYMTVPNPSVLKTLSDVQKEFRRAVALYRDAVPTPEELQALDQLAGDFDRVTAVGSRFVAKTDAIDKSVRRFREDMGKADRILDQVRPLIAQHVQVARDTAKRSTDLAITVILSSAVVGLLFGGFISVVIQRRVTRPLTNMARGMASIAQGDLQSPALVESADETGHLAAAFNRMTRSLRDVLAETKTMTEEVATASSEIATGSQQQVASLTESATAINQITTTAETFKATMQEFADRARAVQEAADETGKRSDDGRGLTRESVTRIEQVWENARAAGESVLDLSEQMQRINEITATVNEIAEQTKLLSLNASIEAARAGEDGRGFAVVATQVRELANQSKEAAGRIEAIISETQTSMRIVVGKIEEGSRLSKESSAIVKRVTEALDEIATAVYQTTEAMNQIATGARDQEHGIAELADGIAQVETASNEALLATRQTQESIAAIDEQMKRLNDTMAGFKT